MSHVFENECLSDVANLLVLMAREEELDFINIDVHLVLIVLCFKKLVNCLLIPPFNVEFDEVGLNELNNVLQLYILFFLYQP